MKGFLKVQSYLGKLVDKGYYCDECQFGIDNDGKPVYEISIGYGSQLIVPIVLTFQTRSHKECIKFLKGFDKLIRKKLQ